MNWKFEIMYELFLRTSRNLLLDGKWGIERELQRVTYEGDLALTPHPKAFGDKLKNKEITTDFSESQMELITPAFSSVEQVDDYLKYLYEEARKGVGRELLWPLSMPPRLPDEEFIPISQFDHSEEGLAAYLYRQGLANRYGKKMQMISGIHFNFSFGEELLQLLYSEFGLNSDARDMQDIRRMPEFSDELYFSVARNFLRYRWLLIYLLGASPSFDATYDTVLKEQVENIRKCCPECCEQYDNYATSLRVSRYGYSNPEQVRYSTYYNSKKEYIQGIRELLSQKSFKFANLGIQLNTNILQKDSEFYSPIRLKQITKQGESQIDALDRRGVKYAEVRILDINPYIKTGISLEQMRFLQVFMLYCLFEENRPIDSREMSRINENHHLIALSGRKPGLMLNRLEGGKISLKEWGEDIFNKLTLIAKLLDQADNGNTDNLSVKEDKENTNSQSVKEERENTYSLILQEEYRKLNDEALLPSAILQNEMNNKNESFLEFGIRKAKEYKRL